MIKFFLVISLMIYFYPLAEAAPGKAIVELTTYPEEPQNFQPYYEGNQPAKIAVVVKDAAGKPIKDVWIELRITHRKGRGILSTGFPYIEGKETLGGKFFAPEGKLELEYLFPIRGNYDVEVITEESSSSLPQFQSVSEISRVHVKEPFFEIRNAALLVGLLFVLGLFLGRTYAKASSAKGMIFFVLLLAAFPGVQGESAKAGAEISFDPPPQVGTPSTARIVVHDAEGKAKINLQITLPHARARMVSGDFYTLDGTLELKYTFQDADTYVFIISASPADGAPAEFEAFTRSYAVKVAPPEAPVNTWLKTWAILMGVILAGMGIGYFVTKK